MMEKREDLAGTILYVDDEELARKYFVRTAGNDYNVLTANDANAAMGILQAESGRIGVVVTDFRMPGRDGGDLLRQIEQEYPNVVRILTTAYADKTLLLDTINSADVFRILEKPLDLEEVRRALRLAMELARDRISNRQKIMAMNETLAFLAHELNTPLATIVNFSRGIAQRLADGHAPLYGSEPAGSWDPAAQMHDAGSRAAIARAAVSVNDNARYCLTVLSSFVDSVRNRGLNFGEEAGSAASGLLESLLDTYPMTPDQRSMITVHVEQDFRIAALPNCVALVLSSVIGNALRALQARNRPNIHIAIRGGEDEPRILIADNGPGIPPHVLERLTVDPITTHAAVGGSGRGVIFCHRIMQSFGGSLQIESDPEQCTTVTLIFPAVRHTIKRSA